MALTHLKETLIIFFKAMKILKTSKLLKKSAKKSQLFRISENNIFLTIFKKKFKFEITKKILDIQWTKYTW